MNRINLVCLGVKDIQTSLNFYKNIGFQTFVKDEQPSIVFFNNQGSKLELYPLEALAKDINADLPIHSNGFNGITLACNTKSEDEVNQLLHLAAQYGGEIVKPAQHVFWGGYSGYFKDPDGYYWEVAYSSNWKFDDQDMLIIEE